MHEGFLPLLVSRLQTLARDLLGPGQRGIRPRPEASLALASPFRGLSGSLFGVSRAMGERGFATARADTPLVAGGSDVFRLSFSKSGLQSAMGWVIIRFALASQGLGQDRLPARAGGEQP